MDMHSPSVNSSSLPGSRLDWREWRWWYLIFGVVAFFLGTSLPTFLNVTDMTGQVLLFVVYAVIAVAVPALLGRGRGLADYGLRCPNWRRVLIVAIVAYVSFMLVVRAWEHGTGGSKGPGLLVELGLGREATRDVALIFCICMIGPMAEELLFRGMMFRSLRDGMGRWRWMPKWLAVVVAILFSAYMFMNIHGGSSQDSQLTMLMVMGVVYAIAYEVSGSLYAPIIAHSLNNTVAVWRGMAHNADQALPSAAWMGLLIAAPFVAVGMAWLIGKMVGRWSDVRPASPSADSQGPRQG